MTGEEHAELAEALVLNADDLLETAADRHGEAAAEAGFYMAVARAQVHATLALVDAVKALTPQKVEITHDLNDVVEPGSVQDQVRRAARTNVGFPTF